MNLCKKDCDTRSNRVLPWPLECLVGNQPASDASHMETNLSDINNGGQVNNSKASDNWSEETRELRKLITCFQKEDHADKKSEPDHKGSGTERDHLFCRQFIFGCLGMDRDKDGHTGKEKKSDQSDQGDSTNNDKELYMTDEEKLQKIDTLLDNGADLQAKDDEGETLLHEAARCQRKDVGELLINRGAKVKAEDKQGRQPLHVAAAKDNVAMVELLLDNGAKTSDQDKAGRTAIAFAAANDGIEAMKLLESRGADINKRDKKQRTPLMLAALGDRSESCKLLLKMGAKADVKDIYGEPCIVTMLAKMQTVARIALDQFHRVNGASRTQHFDLYGLEPMEQEGGETDDNKNPPQPEEGKLDKEDLSKKEGKSDNEDLGHRGETNDNKNPQQPEGELNDNKNNPQAEKPKRKIRTPMQVVVHDRQLENIEHKVFCELIEVKWKQFGRFWAWFDFILDLTFIILWTALATIKPDARACYYFPGDIWRVILWICAIGYTVFLIIQELREFWTSKRELHERKDWKLWILENDMEDCHPKWPQEKEWLDNEIKEINKMKASYFHDYWNIFDWFVYILLTACVVLHFIDIGIVPHELCWPDSGNTTGNATTEPVKVDDDEIESLASRLHIRVFSITIIFVWVRILKSARAFMTLGPFIAMCYKILADVARFLFLYLVFYIPYTSAFWMMFGGDVEEFETISETLFSLFRMTLVDEYNYEGLKEENPVMCDILVGTYLAISAIVLLNLFIAMLSETFVRIHDNAYSIALMERAQIILSIEDNLSDSKKTQFREYIKKRCNPLEKFYDDDMAFESESKDFKKVTFQIKEQLKALSEQLSITSNDAMNGQAEMNTNKQRINDVSSEKRYEQEINRINKELGQLKAQLTESTADIKNILSILTKTAKKPKGPTDKSKSYHEGDDDGSLDGKKRKKRRPRPKTEAFTEDYLGSEATSQQRHQPSTGESIEMEDLDGSTEA